MQNVKDPRVGPMVLVPSHKGNMPGKRVPAFIVWQGRSRNAEIISTIQPRNAWHMIKYGLYFGYWDFERQGVSPPLHLESPKREMISRFSISATGTLKDKGSLLHCI
jgi:hypothetical protein